MGDDQRQRHPGAQRGRHDDVDDGGGHGYGHGADGMREEDFEQFHVGGEHGDEVALALAGELGRSEAAKGGESLGAEEREQVEGHVVVQILLNVARQAAQHRANNHGGDCTGRTHAPHGVAGERESGDDAEHR